MVVLPVTRGAAQTRFREGGGKAEGSREWVQAGWVAGVGPMIGVGQSEVGLFRETTRHHTLSWAAQLDAHHTTI